MTEETIANAVSRHFSSLTFDQLPGASVSAVKRLLLDYFGVAIAGSQTGSGKIASRFAELHQGVGECTLIGSGAKVPATLGAFANAISSHSIELDDIDVLALFHFSPPVYSAALAVAEKCNADGQQLVTALAAGCEMMERTSRAANNSLRDRAYHTTPTCGVFGATVGAGVLLGLSQEQMASSLGLAGAQASGLMEMYGPSMQKRFNPGPAARNGVTSALMAQLGFTGADTIFEGERGFLKAFTDKSDSSKLIEDIGKPYQLDIEFKPHSCARPIHNSIDCALVVRARDNPDLARIRHIQIERHSDWGHYHLNKTPRTYHEAQVSLPYATAVAFKEGQALLAQFTDEKLKDPTIVRLMQLMDISIDDSLPRGVSCRMIVTMDDGRKLVSQVDYPKGSIQNAMSDAELRGKFESLASPVLGASRAAEIADKVAAIETCTSLGGLIGLMRKQ
jgi:2-methylcitrate dehydratase PrpD